MDFQPDPLFVSLSTAESTLDKARGLLNICGQHRELETALAASSMVLAAASLEQFTWTALSHIAQRDALNNSVEPSDTEAGKALEAKSTFKWRIKEAARLLSRGTLELDPGSETVRDLYELIFKRNSLMHVSEEAIEAEFIGIEENEDDPESVFAYFKTIISIPAWNSVSPAQAEKYIAAVRAYFDEVLIPGEPISGSLCRFVRNR